MPRPHQRIQTGRITRHDRVPGTHRPAVDLDDCDEMLIYFETVTAEAMHHLGAFRPIGWIVAHASLVMGPPRSGWGSRSQSTSKAANTCTPPTLSTALGSEPSCGGYLPECSCSSSSCCRSRLRQFSRSSPSSPRRGHLRRMGQPDEYALAGRSRTDDVGVPRMSSTAGRPSPRRA